MEEVANCLEGKGKFGSRALFGSKIARFLRRLEFQEADKDGFGAMWIELFAVYKAMGYSDPIVANSCSAKSLPSLGKQIHAFKMGVRKINRVGVQGECKSTSVLGQKGGMRSNALE